MRLRAALLASAVLAAMPALASDPEFLVLDWAGFEDEGLYATYLEKHGTAPGYTFYGDDDEAYQKVASGFRADVAHPCSQMIGKYRDAGLIECACKACSMWAISSSVRASKWLARLRADNRP